MNLARKIASAIPLLTVPFLIWVTIEAIRTHGYGWAASMFWCCVLIDLMCCAVLEGIKGSR